MITYFKSARWGSLIICLVLPYVISGANVKDYGARGDGVTDDYEAIMEAARSSTDGVLLFPAGQYRVTRTIHLNLSRVNISKVEGVAGNSTILMEGPGAAVLVEGTHDGTALPATVSKMTWSKEKLFTIEHIEIKGAHPKADGIHLKKLIQPIVSQCLIRRVKNGICFLSRNRNVLLLGNQIYDCDGVGVYLDSVNIHQININDNHISYCKQGGIKIRHSEIRNIQIVGNDIEYNHESASGGPASADIWVDCSKGGSVREGTISGNTIQAIPHPGGANIRLSGRTGDYNKIGLLSITGNHISNQDVNIELDHCRGVSVTGNTFIRGYDRHMIINTSRNVTISGNVFDRNEDYFPESVNALGGIVIGQGRNILLSDNIIEGGGTRNGTIKGAVAITDSREVSVNGCHIQNPEFSGIEVANSVNVQITNSLIQEDKNPGRMSSGIHLRGACPGTRIHANTIGAGKQGAIVNNATGVRIQGTVFTDEK